MLNPFFSLRNTQQANCFTRPSVSERVWELCIAKVNLALFCSLGLLESTFIMVFLIPWNTYVVIWKISRLYENKFVCCLRNRIRKLHCFNKKSVLRRFFKTKNQVTSTILITVFLITSYWHVRTFYPERTSHSLWKQLEMGKIENKK